MSRDNCSPQRARRAQRKITRIGEGEDGRPGTEDGGRETGEVHGSWLMARRGTRRKGWDWDMQFVMKAFIENFTYLLVVNLTIIMLL